MKDLAARSREPELMEVESLGFAATDETLRQLATVNRLSLAYGPTLRWLDQVAAKAAGAPLSILDVACGHGDMLRRMRRWADRRGLDVTLTGVDLDPDCVRSAEQATPPEARIRYEVHDALTLPGEPGFDVITSSLFTHHLFDAGLTTFLAWMDRTARRGWLSSDLHRHPVPYHFVKAWFRLAGFNRYVATDGPISVARGFTRAEWEGHLRDAGIDPARVEVSWHVPFRWRVACLR